MQLLSAQTLLSLMDFTVRLSKLFAAYFQGRTKMAQGESEAQLTTHDSVH